MFMLLCLFLLPLSCLGTESTYNLDTLFLRYVDPTLLAGSPSNSAVGQEWWRAVPDGPNFTSTGAPSERREARTLFVADGSAGSVRRNGSIDTPFFLSDIAQHAYPGDVFWVRGGRYSGNFELPGGTASAPIVVRAVPTERPVIHGSISLRSPHVWLWGIEITDPTDVASGGQPSLLVDASSTRVINCVIHDTHTGSGIYAPAGNPDQLFYGNVIYRVAGKLGQVGHGIFAQHAPGVDGNESSSVTGADRKYFVSNMVFEAGAANCDRNVGCYTFYGYADPDEDEWEEERASGFYLKHNVFAGGTALLGGRGPPSVDLTATENLLLDARLQLGYRQPSQASVTSNKVYWSHIEGLLWGTGERVYEYPALPSRYEGNAVMNPDGPVLKLRTSSYQDEYRHGDDTEVKPDFRDTDVVGGNTYYPANATFSVAAGGLIKDNLTFTEFRTATAAAGLNAGVGSATSGSVSWLDQEVRVVENMYDSSLSHIVVVNPRGLTANTSSIAISQSLLRIKPGMHYEVHDTMLLHSGAHVEDERQAWPPIPLETGAGVSGAKVGVPLDRVQATQAAAGGRYSLWTLWRDRWRAGQDFPIDVPELEDNPNLYPSAGILGNAAQATATLSTVYALLLVAAAFA